MNKFLKSIFLPLAAVAVALTSFSCSDDDDKNSPNEPSTPVQSNMTELNKWIFDYMKDYYLWNEPVSGLSLNGSAKYDDFFQSILTGVDALNHMNRDDGHWASGKRQYYYSYIEQSSASKSRAFDETETGSGISFMSATLVPGSETDVWLLPAIIVPDSPADQAGIVRGDAISTINGTTITTSNYETMAEKLNKGGVKVTHLKLKFNSSGSFEGYDSYEDVSLAKATFEDPAIYKTSVLTLNGGKKVGYLLYMYFDMDYDDQLIDIFNQFKEQGVTDLVLDLRYNGGGHVLASTLLGTLIAGKNHDGEVYNRTTYNKTRSDKGEIGEYKFGTAKTPEGNYKKIATAVASSLGLNQIYVLCSESTASASELIINGLRGVDVTVNLVGTTTNGKNVGMESIAKVFGNYKYTLTPITFYSQNAKNFRDYANGFTPDVAIDEDEYLYGDFGTMSDPLCNVAFRWIANGSKPNLSISRAGNPVSKLEIKGQHLPDRLKGSIVLRNDAE